MEKGETLEPGSQSQRPSHSFRGRSYRQSSNTCVDLDRAVPCAAHHLSPVFSYKSRNSWSTSPATWFLSKLVGSSGYPSYYSSRGLHLFSRGLTHKGSRSTSVERALVLFQPYRPVSFEAYSSTSGPTNNSHVQCSNVSVFHDASLAAPSTSQQTQPVGTLTTAIASKHTSAEQSVIGTTEQL
ncbi:hypothetical protein ACP70R_029315 [Stipagrostis hirtigluma subsp. patula]